MRPGAIAALLAALLACEGTLEHGLDPAIDLGPSDAARALDAGRPDAAPGPRDAAPTPDGGPRADGGPAPDAAPDPDAAPPPSVLDRPLADETIYFVLTDRFANGDPGNDQGGAPGALDHGGLDPANPRFWHGGDLAGVLSKLDYLEDLGVTALWLTPVVGQRAISPSGRSGGYHGYWGLDFEHVDPHLGTDAGLVALVEAAHGRGMKVFLDVVLNHTADVIVYEGGDTRWRPLDEPAHTPVVPAGLEAAKAPAWLNDPARYNNRGNSTFEGPSAIYGDFQGLDDLDTRQDVVIDGLAALFAEWVRWSEVDGFRLDTVKHVDLPLWPRFAAAMAEAGPRWFTLFGEVFDGDPNAVSRYTTVGRLPSALDFPLQGTLRAVVAQGQPPVHLARLFEADDRYVRPGLDARDLVTFSGNHDMGRFAAFVRADDPGVDEATALARVELAHALLFLTRGAPVIYYGDEQGMAGAVGGTVARQDLMPAPAFAGEDMLGTAATPGDENFDPNHRLYRAFAELAAVRHRLPALRRGVQLARYASSSGPGLFAASRVLPDDPVEHLVVANTRGAPITRTFATDSPGATFQRVFGEGEARADAGGQVTVTLPAHGYAVLVADRPMAAPTLGAPRLQGTELITAEAERVEITAAIDGGAGAAQVRFEARVDAGPWGPLGVDHAPPFRVLADVTGLPSQGTLTVRATVEPLGGGAGQAATRAMRIDRRVVPGVRLTYQNGNARRLARAWTLNGRPLGAAPVGDDDTVAWALPDQAERVVVVFEGDDGRIDAPIELAVADLLDHVGDGPEAWARLFVDADGRVVPSAAAFSAGRPAEWTPADPLESAPPMFLRGSFDGWEAGRGLAPGEGRWSATLDLPAGAQAYKFADASWSDPWVIGGPLGAQGLDVGGGTQNLRLTVPRAGRYTLSLLGYRTPEGALRRLPRIEGGAPGP